MRQWHRSQVGDSFVVDGVVASKLEIALTPRPHVLCSLGRVGRVQSRLYNTKSLPTAIIKCLLVSIVRSCKIWYCAA